MAAYIIAHPEIVVAADLAESIIEFDPCAKITSRRSLLEILSPLETMTRIALAFLYGPSEDIVRLGIDEAVILRGGRMILLDHDVSDTLPTGTGVLRQPFIPEMVLPFLRSVGGWGIVDE